MNLKHHQAHVPHHYHRSFAWATVLNTLYACVEWLAGWWLNSVALMADAGHNFTDVLALVLAWGAYRLASVAVTERRTYGLQRLTILASLSSGLLLLLAVGGILWEAILRIIEPATSIAVNSTTTGMIWIALLGVAINTVTALLFHRGSHHDLNLRGAWLHLLADAAVSLGVVVAALVIRYTHWYWLDPVVAIAIAVVIFWATWGLLKESLNLASDGVPAHVDTVAVRAYFCQQPGVEEVHDLHIWPLSTTETALTVHLVLRQMPQDNRFLYQLVGDLQHRFGIDHPTIQIEHRDRYKGLHPQCDVKQA
ncbi:MAG: cation diffusion facilitator family transporter [Xanthomonadales bacterium]|jgi:cobalt-zinc-cadmium efflux system protein|nr:cation diffusion facilitator family transporter [Xanthomonadales bacterium]